jgi:glycosyltransferase involved in cell wall biosynthesis
MHIAVDCRSVHPHMGGIGRAALELVRALGAEPRSHRISMIVGKGHSCDLQFTSINVVTAEAAMIDERFEQLYLPSLLAELGVDLYLNSTFSIPAIKTTRYQLAIIHDVVFEDRPEYVEPRLRSYLSRWSRFTATHADRVLTVSDHARDRISSTYGIDRSRVVRAYNGIAALSFEAPDEGDVTLVRVKYHLKDPFILYLGTVEIKKGICELLRAFRLTLDAGFSGCLVLAGGKGGPDFVLEREVRAAGCEGRVRALGYVDETDKKPLLRACTLFVYPSLYEGFGLPPLEAMALGVPCVVSDQTSLPEIVGDAALVARVQDPPDFARALDKGLSDKGFRAEAGIAGPARAREFSWERSAGEILDLCQSLGGL